MVWNPLKDRDALLALKVYVYVFTPEEFGGIMQRIADGTDELFIAVLDTLIIETLFNPERAKGVKPVTRKELLTSENFLNIGNIIAFDSAGETEKDRLTQRNTAITQKIFNRASRYRQEIIRRLFLSRDPLFTKVFCQLAATMRDNAEHLDELWRETLDGAAPKK